MKEVFNYWPVANLFLRSVTKIFEKDQLIGGYKRDLMEGDSQHGIQNNKMIIHLHP